MSSLAHADLALPGPTAAPQRLAAWRSPVVRRRGVLRTAIEDLDLEHPGNAPFDRVTISVGGCIVNRERLGDTDDAWFESADAALYTAKRAGRNRSVIA